MFLSSNTSVQQGLAIDDFSHLLWLLFLFNQILLWYLIILPKQWKNPLFYITLLTLIGFSRIRTGEFGDFTMRATIPAFFTLMMLVMDTFKKRMQDATQKCDFEKRYIIKRINYKKLLWACVILMMLSFAAISPVMEMGRSIRVTREAYRDGRNPEAEFGYLFNNHDRENFTGGLDSFFFRVLAREARHD